MIKFVDLNEQYSRIKDDVDSAIKSVVESGMFILGENVKLFEKEFADFCKSPYSISVDTGTSALHIALVAFGIKAGDEVITVPNTFLATCEAISYTGAKPVLVDISPETYTIDTSEIEDAITEKTKAIIPVHLYGQTADMEEIMKIARKHNLKIIEDACQAHGAEQNGKRVPISSTGCFSFYPGKNLGAFGEGGAVVSENKEFILDISIYRDHGQEKKNLHKYIGYNYRLEELQAAILRVKLKHLDEWTEMRRENAKLYNELLEGSKVVTPIEKKGNKHVYHLYVIRAWKRDKLMQHLNSKGIQTGIHYPTPIHLTPAYSHLGYKKGSFPIAEQYADEILSLPMYPELKEEEIKTVVGEIKKFSK